MMVAQTYFGTDSLPSLVDTIHYDNEGNRISLVSYSNKIFENARSLRQTSTEAEETLWQELRDRKLNELKFRRQHPIDKWIADFYCHEKKLVIELYGSVHNEKEIAEYDAGREKDLKELGFNVMRFKNDEVLTDIEFVLKRITEFCQQL